MNKRRAAVLTVLCFCMLVACADNIPTPIPTEATVMQSPLPTPTAPESTVSIVPTPSQGLPEEMLVAFRLEKPLRAGDTVVRGLGPQNVPIVLADVTFMGEPIVFGTIGADGTFAFELPAPLEEGHRIGLGLGDLGQTPWSEEDFRDPRLYGDEALSVPNVGFFYDTNLVAP